MYILVQTDPLEDNNDTIFIVRVPELEEKYQHAGYQKRERSYKLKYQHKEYTVLCPEYRNDEIGAKPIVIIPVFFIPRRQYPVHVYLYGIDLYSNNPGMGQREAAAATRKLFGLTHFAHTTLGRALKVFVLNIEEASAGSLEESRDDGLLEIRKEHVVQHTSSVKRDEQKNDAKKQFSFPTTQTTAAWRKRAARILEEKISWGLTASNQFCEACLEFAKEWFKKSCRLLL